MFVTVTGGSGSGKSAFAEDVAVRLGSGKEDRGGGCGLVYLATMKPDGQEAASRIHRHRLLRAGKGFTTLEKSCGLSGISPVILEGRTVLLEDLSNLIANELFTGHPDDDPDCVYESVLKETEYVRRYSDNLVIVMNEIFSDGEEYDWQTDQFLRLAGRLNCRLAEMADVRFEVVYGIPVKTG